MRTGDGLNRLILTGLSDYAGVVPESIPVGVIDELRATLFLLLRPLENRLPARRFNRGGCNRLNLVEAPALEVLDLGLDLFDGHAELSGCLVYGQPALVVREADEMLQYDRWNPSHPSPRLPERSGPFECRLAAFAEQYA